MKIIQTMNIDTDWNWNGQACLPYSNHRGPYIDSREIRLICRISSNSWIGTYSIIHLLRFIDYWGFELGGVTCTLPYDEIDFEHSWYRFHHRFHYLDQTVDSLDFCRRGYSIVSAAFIYASVVVRLFGVKCSAFFSLWS